ncbi:MAG: FtsW/RodA/SpoVE family cell cycle protein, partial [Candidatus Eremiobacteraeota bacterium]|nr:FtsW/RodA/SpoVE family cell cycle protein [Candidatus Eremiobacteraeota bacterium]
MVERAPIVVPRTPVARGGPDAVIVFAIGTLVAIGLVMIFSASSYLAVAMHHDATYFFKRQVVWFAVGLIPAYVAYRMDYHKLKNVAPLFVGAVLVLLVLVLVPHVGIFIGGARRWLGFGSMSFEPSEFAKLALVVYLAAALATKGERVRSLVSGVVPLAFVTLLLAMLVLKEPDMGTASMLVFTSVVMLFAAGARIAHLLMMAAVTMPWVVLLVMHDTYKRARILAFLDPWKDPQDKGFHIVQSLLALGSGGAFGQG